MAEKTSLIDLYNNKVLASEVYTMFHEKVPYREIKQYLAQKEFNISIGSLTNFKNKMEESEQTGTPLIQLLDKRRKDRVSDLPNVTGYQPGKEAPDKVEDPPLPEVPLPKEQPEQTLNSPKELLELIMQKGYNAVRNLDVVDTGTTLKAADQWNKYYQQDSDGLTTSAIKQYQVLVMGELQGMMEVVSNYVPKNHQEEAMNALKEWTDDYLKNVVSSEDGKRLVAELKEHGIDL